MRRTQLLLAPWQHEALRSLAERQGTSLSAVVRAILTEHLGPRPEAGVRDRLEELAGVVDDPGTSGADHDDALYPPA